MRPTSAWHMADWRRKSRQCSDGGGVSQCSDEGEGWEELTVVQTVHLFLSWGTFLEVVVLVHVLVETFLEILLVRSGSMRRMTGQLTMQWTSCHMFSVPTYPEPSGIATPFSLRP